MTTPRFNQDPGADYGKCNTCGIALPTEQDASDHREATLEASKVAGGSKSHSTRTTNPSREDRIENNIGSLIEGAIQDVLSSIDDLIAADHITEEEAVAALKLQHVDFLDEWKEYSA